MSKISHFDRYDEPELHICPECGERIDVGDSVVSLSKGEVLVDTNYHLENTQLFHTECWEEKHE